MMKIKELLFGLFLLGLTYSCSQESQLTTTPETDLGINKRSQVVLSAGSTDELDDAIATAGPNGTVIVESGIHYLTATVTITERVTIKGESGATIIASTTSTPPAIPLNPAIHIYGADKTSIEGIMFQAETDPGGTGVLVDNAEKVSIKNAGFQGFQFSIMLEQADQAIITGNTVVGSGAWLTGQVDVLGITVINGDKVQIKNNVISNAIFGLWACDEDGLAIGNEFFGNLYGLILCKVPPSTFPLPSGAFVGSENSGTNWVVTNNNSHNNFDSGYLVVDGSNNNSLSNNLASNNGNYDFELAGDTPRFGFPAPTSFENHVNVGNNTMTVKDCGIDNVVVGGNMVDTGADSCY